MINILSKLGIEGTYFNIMKTYKKSTVLTSYFVNNWKLFFKDQEQTKVPFLQLLF